MYTYVYIYTYICIYVSTYIKTYRRLFVSARLLSRTHILIHIYVYTYRRLCVGARLFALCNTLQHTATLRCLSPLHKHTHSLFFFLPLSHAHAYKANRYRLFNVCNNSFPFWLCVGARSFFFSLYLTHILSRCL